MVIIVKKVDKSCSVLIVNSKNATKSVWISKWYKFIWMAKQEAWFYLKNTKKYDKKRRPMLKNVSFIESHLCGLPRLHEYKIIKMFDIVMQNNTKFNSKLSNSKLDNGCNLCFNLWNFISGIFWNESLWYLHSEIQEILG